MDDVGEVNFMNKDLEEGKGHGNQCINGEVALNRSRASHPL